MSEEARWLNKGEDKTIDKGPFTDPVVRCDSCTGIVKTEVLKRIGACPSCGNKRVRNVTVFNEKERDQMTEWGFVRFVSEFGEIADE